MKKITLLAISLLATISMYAAPGDTVFVSTKGKLAYASTACIDAGCVRVDIPTGGSPTDSGYVFGNNLLKFGTPATNAVTQILQLIDLKGDNAIATPADWKLLAINFYLVYADKGASASTDPVVFDIITDGGGTPGSTSLGMLTPKNMDVMNASTTDPAAMANIAVAPGNGINIGANDKIWVAFTLPTKTSDRIGFLHHLAAPYKPTCPNPVTTSNTYYRAGSALYPVSGVIGGAKYELYMSAVICKISTGINENSKYSLKLNQNTPNPANNECVIGYEIAKTSNVVVTVSDLTGKEVMKLNEGSKNAGQYNLKMDLSSIPSGIYFYTLQAGDDRLVNKMVVTK